MTKRAEIMIHMIASKMLNDFIESQDKVDYYGVRYGGCSVEFSEAMEQHLELRDEMHRLLCIALTKEFEE